MKVSIIETHDQWESEIPQRTPLWWYVVCITWGAILTLVVYSFDRNAASACWAAGGFGLAVVGYPAFRWLVVHVVEYYAERDQSDAGQRLRVLRQLGAESPEYRAELGRANEDAIPIAMFVGTLHGAIVGSRDSNGRSCE